MCDKLEHPMADRLGLENHNHEEQAEAQLTAAFVSELGSEDQSVALALASVEAMLAMAHELRALREALQKRAEPEPLELGPLEVAELTREDS